MHQIKQNPLEKIVPPKIAVNVYYLDLTNEDWNEQSYVVYEEFKQAYVTGQEGDDDEINTFTGPKRYDKVQFQDTDFVPSLNTDTDDEDTTYEQYKQYHQQEQDSEEVEDMTYMTFKHIHELSEEAANNFLDTTEQQDPTFTYEEQEEEEDTLEDEVVPESQEDLDYLENFQDTQNEDNEITADAGTSYNIAVDVQNSEDIHQRRPVIQLRPCKEVLDHLLRTGRAPAELQQQYDQQQYQNHCQD